MGASDFAEWLKPFPALQTLVAGAVAVALIIATLRGVKENKRDAHIAPTGHDPLGLAVLANQMLGYVVVIAEQGRNHNNLLASIHTEQVKTNSRLAALEKTHISEMDRLRETVDDAEEKQRPRPRPRA